MILLMEARCDSIRSGRGVLRLGLRAARPALALLIAAPLSRYFAVFGLVLALPGLSLLLLGARRTRISPSRSRSESSSYRSHTSRAHRRLAECDCRGRGSLLDGLGAPVVWEQSTCACPGGSSHQPELQRGVGAVRERASPRWSPPPRVRASAQWLPVLVVYPLVIASQRVALRRDRVLRLRFGGEYLNTPIHGLSGIAVYAAVLVMIWICADRDSFRRAVS